MTNSAIVGERPATGSTTERTHGHTYLDGVRVQRAGVVSPDVVLVASSAEDAPTNQANPEVVGCPALLRICGHAPGERKNRHKSGVREAYTSQLPNPGPNELRKNSNACRFKHSETTKSATAATPPIGWLGTSRLLLDRQS